MNKDEQLYLELLSARSACEQQIKTNRYALRVNLVLGAVLVIFLVILYMI
jgi:hypothetical protein